MRTARTQICAHVKDPIYICRKRIGFAAGGMEPRKHCTQGRKLGRAVLCLLAFPRESCANFSCKFGCVHYTGTGVRHKQICTRVDSEGQKNCSSPCATRGSNSGSWCLNSDSLATEIDVYSLSSGSSVRSCLDPAQRCTLVF